mmetsp:Transcript_19748/g.25575  ORF Transcript_19748/g.25575 Transcript_19748/m.25575 type:complete len:314 (-) Transcript_19748:51-992(-)|eukprot:CAMPEP_0197285446 /NCGR_PEP_ID=MMETSP0890-20130614/739_1 /TAXON_ID=44058 ORGANISM="Aureoumbra lagunensis, Strain CCMP1510" /NCGR_SAMPLE_ID=MMETSP0890 /ASSEMBLY_ACC=CAM_ASM_000533 /LENGTH=313 /DNA_ID=CAMNT_0042752959 /DNA_START=25 /DNA_END=966 /DNA_ORIENTATION=-
MGEEAPIRLEHDATPIKLEHDVLTPKKIKEDPPVKLKHDKARVNPSNKRALPNLKEMSKKKAFPKKKPHVKTKEKKKPKLEKWIKEKASYLEKHPFSLAGYILICLLLFLYILRLCRRRRRRKTAAKSKREGFNRWDPRAGLAPTWSTTALPPTVKRACQRGDIPQVIQWLSAAGNIDARDADGRSALHYAASSGHSELVKTLLTEAHASPDALDNFKQSPLHAAAQAGSASAVRTLLDNGADVSLRDNAGRTPLNAADDAGNFGCSRLIQRRERAIARGGSTSSQNASLTQRRGSGGSPLSRPSSLSQDDAV